MNAAGKTRPTLRGLYRRREGLHGARLQAEGGGHRRRLCRRLPHRGRPHQAPDGRAGHGRHARLGRRARHRRVLADHRRRRRRHADDLLARSAQEPDRQAGRRGVRGRRQRPPRATSLYTYAAIQAWAQAVDDGRQSTEPRRSSRRSTPAPSTPSSARRSSTTRATSRCPATSSTSGRTATTTRCEPHPRIRICDPGASRRRGFSLPRSGGLRDRSSLRAGRRREELALRPRQPVMRRAASAPHIRGGTGRASAGSARPRRRRSSSSAGRIGGITLKPSAAPDANQSSMMSAICSGVPATVKWPRAPARLCSSWRSVGRSRATQRSDHLGPALRRLHRARIGKIVDREHARRD